MSTIKSSDEHLTLNADGSGNDIKFQSNGSEVASISDAGKITATNFAANADDLEIQSSTGEKMIKCVKDAQVNLYYDNSVKLATSSTGVTVTGGVAIGGTGTANTLDDYEEGTHTVTVTMGTGSAVLHTSHRTFQYTKVGRVVHVSGQVLIDSASNADGEFQMSLPFTVGNGASFYSVGNYRTYNVDTPNDGVQAVVFANSNEAKCNFAWSRDQATSTNERATVNGYYMIGLTYMT